MSTAARVPETHDLEGDDALRTLRRTGWGRLAKDSWRRFRAADGTTHARALAYQVTLTLLPAVIAVVGLATAFGAGTFQRTVKDTLVRVAPGPAGGAVLLWFVFTGLLALYLSSSSSFGRTYGPLTGIVAVLVWTFLTSLALYLGL